MSSYEQKRNKTRQLITNSFIKLARSKDIDEITVSDINDLAKIGRSTFYRYFDSKKDLINDIEYTILDKIENKINHLNYDFSIDDFSDREFIDGFLRLIEQYQLPIKLLTSDQGDAKFNYQFTHLILKFGDKRTRYMIGNASKKNQVLYSHYFGGAIVGVIKHWIEDYPDCSKADVFNFLMELRKHQIKNKYI